MTAGPATPTGASGASARSVKPSAAYLLARVGIVESRVRALIAHRRRDDPSPEDPFRGLYVSDEHVEQLLAGGPASSLIEWDDGTALQSIEDEADEVEAGGTDLRLRASGPSRRPRRPRRGPPAHRPRSRPRRPLRTPVRLSERRRDPSAGDHRARARAGGHLAVVGWSPGQAGCPRSSRGGRPGAGRGTGTAFPFPIAPGA